VETIGSKRSHALTWCMPNNGDDGDDDDISTWVNSVELCTEFQQYTLLSY